jgi:hypothetical protein
MLMSPSPAAYSVASSYFIFWIASAGFNPFGHVLEH